MNDLKSKIEAILFVAGDLIDIESIAQGLEVEPAEIRKQVSILSDEYNERNAGMKVVWVKDSVQMSTREDFSEDISNVLAPLKTTSLSNSAIETLSIIAYKQPITRTEVAELRGVRSDYAINMLIQRGMIETAGRKDALGSPMMFKTTELFLREFNLNSIDDLPKIEDLESLVGEHENANEEIDS